VDRPARSAGPLGRQAAVALSSRALLGMRIYAFGCMDPTGDRGTAVPELGTELAGTP
jgi:hypothetical protein